MKWYERFWPWKKFRADALRIVELQQELRFERTSHADTMRCLQQAKQIIEAHEKAAHQNHGHMRKLVGILALKGGIPLKG